MQTLRGDIKLLFQNHSRTQTNPTQPRPRVLVPAWHGCGFAALMPAPTRSSSVGLPLAS